MIVIPVDPVVRARVTVPDVIAGAIERPGLSARIDEALAGPGSLLVSSLAGYGRRDVLVRWAATQPPGRVAWLDAETLDEPRRLFRHLVEALRAVDPTCGAGALAAVGDAVDTIEAWGLPELMADVEAWTAPATLIIDSVHDLRDLACRSLVRAVQHSRPPVLRLVLVTSDDAAVHRYERAGLQITRLTEGDLAYDRAEVAATLQAWGVAASPDEVDDLLEATAGWPWGVYQTAQSAAASGQLVPFRITDPISRDFLHAHVCDRLTPELRDMLQDVAVLDHADDDLLAAVTDRSDVGHLVHRLAELRLVVDDDPTRLRVPTIVRRHVLAEQRQLDPAGLVRLRRRAADALVARGRPDEALEQLGAAGDDDGLRTLIAGRHRQWSASGRAAVVRRWCDHLLQRNPADVEILLARAWADLLAGEAKSAVATATMARRLAPAGPLEQLARSETEIIESIGARWAGRCDDALLHALAGADVSPDIGSASAVYLPAAAESLPLYVGGALFYAGELEDARTELLRACAARTWSPVALSAMHGTLALIGWLEDDPSARIHAAIAASNLAAGLRSSDAVAAAAMAIVGDDDDADRAAERLGVLAEGPVEPAIQVFAHVVAALRSGNQEDARRALAEARDVVERCEQPGVMALLVAKAASEQDLGADAPELGEPLTDGELRVLRALRGSLSEREIAAELNLSHNTVRTYRRRAYRKLGVVSRAAAIARLERLEAG